MRWRESLSTLIITAAACASPSEIDRWIRDLRDDDARWNACGAYASLLRAGRDAVPALEAALDSRDYQQRQLAACILGRFATDPYETVEYEPSPRCVEVLIEGLSSDQLPIARDQHGVQVSRTTSSNAATATWVFIGYAELAGAYRPDLEDVIAAGDAQGSFLAAYILGMNGVEASAAVAAPVLVEHLRDNDISGDAVWAAAALYRLGPAALPYLHTDGKADAQQLRATAHLYQLIAAPPRSQDELIERGIGLSGLYHNAAIEYSHDRPELEWWAFR